MEKTQKQVLEEKIAQYKNFLFYIIEIMSAKGVDILTINDFFAYDHQNKPKSNKLFRMPTILEKFYMISLNQYVSLLDYYYFEYKVKEMPEKNTVFDYSQVNKIAFMTSAKKIVRLSVKTDYNWVYYLLYYFKSVHKIKLTDSFLYFLQYLLDIPPAVLLYAKKHSVSYFKKFQKSFLDSNKIANDKFYAEKIQKIESYLKNIS